MTFPKSALAAARYDQSWRGLVVATISVCRVCADRLTVTAPGVFAVNGYFYNGKVVDTATRCAETGAIACLEAVVFAESVDIPVEWCHRAFNRS
jgi:hypothetical protein